MNPALITLTGDGSPELLGRRHKKKKAKKRRSLKKRVQAIQENTSPAPDMPETTTAPGSAQVDNQSSDDQSSDDQSSDDQSSDSGESVSGDVYDGLPYRPDDVLMGTEITPAPGNKIVLPPPAHEKTDLVGWLKKNPLVAVAALAAVYFLFIKKGRR